MLSAINTTKNNTSFGMIKLPEKGTNGYKILLNRLKSEDYQELDKLVKSHLTNPINVEIVGLFDGVRLGANISNSLTKEYITGDNEYYKFIAKYRSPLGFIKQMAKKADNIWKHITEKAKNISESRLDQIINNGKVQ